MVVVHPGGSAAERLSRLEPGRAAEPDIPALRRLGAELQEVIAPSPSAGLHSVLAAARPALAVAGSAAHAAHGA